MALIVSPSVASAVAPPALSQLHKPRAAAVVAASPANRFPSAFRGAHLHGGQFRGVNSAFAHAARPANPVLPAQRRPGSSVVAAASKGSGKGTVVVAPDPRIPIVLLGVSGALFLADNKLAAAPIGLLGALLAFQTTRVRFVFNEDTLEVRIGAQLESSGENVFVGGENKWRYDSFVNWEFWWPNFPVLVYFKETQTRPEGQVHFFPIICDGKQLYDIMVERCGPSKGSGPSA